MLRAVSPLHALSLLLLLLAAPVFAQEEKTVPWYSGFQFTPGVGARHLGLDVVRKIDGYQGNIANTGVASLFASLSIESPSFDFGETGFGISVYAYAANVHLDKQWVADGGVNPGTNTESGTREDVGTSISGYYSYVVPALHWQYRFSGGGQAKVALGYGKWIARMSGNIILTPDDNPAPGMPTTAIDVSESKYAYLFLMQYKFANHWQAYMTVGGPKWSDGANDYSMEEVSLVLGYTFTL